MYFLPFSLTASACMYAPWIPACLSACLFVCHMTVCMFVCLFVCLSVICLSMYLPACPPVCLSACKSAYLPFSLHICHFACVSACVSACLPVYLLVCLPACMSVCLSVCLTSFPSAGRLCPTVRLPIWELMWIILDRCTTQMHKLPSRLGSSVNFPGCCCCLGGRWLPLDVGDDDDDVSALAA